MKTITHKYMSFRDVVSNAIPGRCYSIAELLQRVLRGQPLPQVGTYEEEKKIPSDKQIDAQIDAEMSFPMNDKDADEIEAFEAKAKVDDHIELVEQSRSKS